MKILVLAIYLAMPLLALIFALLVQPVFVKKFFSGVFSSFYGQHSVTAAWATPSPRNILVAQSNFFQEGKFENVEHFLVHLGMVSGFSTDYFM